MQLVILQLNWQLIISLLNYPLTPEGESPFKIVLIIVYTEHL